MQISEALTRVLRKAGVSLWIMLDRLDEVFPRRSEVETKALRALLRATAALTTDDGIRIKLFIRDDIFDSITDSGFPALTHVTHRCSDTLRWNKDQIQALIVRRAFCSDRLISFFNVDRELLHKDQAYCGTLARYVFPDRIHQSQTIDWIYKHCADGNGVVTPRDVIDLLNLAQGHQIDEYNSQRGDRPTLLCASSVLYGHREMSRRKRENYLKAEFNHFWHMIEGFENNRSEYGSNELRHLLGPEWRRRTKDLQAIGFLKYMARTSTYSVPYLYRVCLNIRQGRANLAPRPRRRRVKSG